MADKDDDDDRLFRERIGRELQRRLCGPSFDSFYDGMTREEFEALKAEGRLPLGIGSYDEVQAGLREREAR